jgi:hypothetical protein
VSSLAADVRRVEVHPPSASEDTVYQDARWLSCARAQYGFLAYPLLALVLAGSISTGVLWHVGVALALFGAPIVICEWRLRKMGFLPEPECIVLSDESERINVGRCVRGDA